MVKIVIGDAKTGKSYQKEFELDLFSGKKIGDKIKGDTLGLKDYELEITGGSDSAGFPLNNCFDSSVRKKILIRGKKGIMRRKNVRGNQFGSYMAQINLKVVKYGSGNLSKLLGVSEKKEKSKEEVKPIEKPKEVKPIEKPKEEKPVEKKPEEKKPEKKIEEKPKDEKVEKPEKKE